MFEIEKGVPVPPISGATRQKYPLGRMEVGDSFLAAAADAHTIRSSANSYSKIHPGFKFRTRTSEDKQYIRIWRVE